MLMQIFHLEKELPMRKTYQLFKDSHGDNWNVIKMKAAFKNRIDKQSKEKNKLKPLNQTINMRHL